MSGPSLRLGLPPRSLFKFPPDYAPLPLPPSYDGINRLANPFSIPADIFQAVLHPAVPLTIAATYAATVSFINAYNRQHGNKPWPISKTRPFYAFVIFHNVFLAVYSAVTCYGMANGLYNSWAGLNGSHGIVGAVDSMCKMHGPRGLGDAIVYNPHSGAWESKNRLIQLAGGVPGPSDIGRLWNEGLAFWGWWFYLSKFYEVLDTFIILAKGKRSTTLQTYHHAGAMLCMWAGIRYMSPPIWLFVQINSAIHAMMYTYYTLSALGFRVPQAIKRSLTTMQITQFIVGASFAAIHLFVYYTIPVSTPYKIAQGVQTAASSVSSVASSAFAEVTAASAVSGLGSLVKQIALRAAGAEGLAENVGERPSHFLKDDILETVHDVTGHHKPASDTLYRDDYQWEQCITTTSQSFAIWLNLIYLAPLTALFTRFFIKSYIKRVSPNKPTTKAASQSVNDAAKGVNHKLEKAGKKVEPNGTNTQKISANANGTLKSRKDEVEQGIEDMKRNISEKLERSLAADLHKSVVNGTKTSTVKENGVKAEKKEKKMGNGLLPSPPASDDDVRREGDDSVHQPEGLSTTDPAEAGKEYADVVKKPSA